MCFVVGILHVLCLSCGAFSPDASGPKFSSSDNKFYRQNLADMLSIPRTKTCYCDRSFTVDGAKQWNELPINIKHSPSLLSFLPTLKNSINAYLLLS